MKKYKENNEAAKAYADLLINDTSTEQLKLQHEAATLDFAAGANWKDKQLSLFGVSYELFLAILDKYQVECQLQYNKGTVPDAGEWFAKNYSR